MRNFVDGVERPQIDHFVKDSRILTWSAVCPECWEVMPTGFDRNAAPEQNYGQEVLCTCCRKRFTFDADSCRIRDMTDGLRHAQQNRHSDPKDQRIAELGAELAQLRPKAAVADNLRHGCAAWKQRAEQAEAQVAALQRAAERDADVIESLSGQLSDAQVRMSNQSTELDRRALTIERLEQQLGDMSLRAQAAETQLASIAKKAPHAT